MSVVNLDSQSGSSANITSELTLTTYTTAADGYISGRVLLSSLNGAAATITVKVQLLDSSNNKLGVPVAFSVAKDAAADTTFAGGWGPVRVLSGQKLRVRALSSNASDTAASWTSLMDDANAPDVSASTVASVTGDVAGNVDGSVNSVASQVGVGTIADGAITSVTLASNALAAISGDVWANGTRTLTAGTNIVLAKGTGITGFNDIAATAIVSNGAITTNGSGKVSGVVLTDTLTTYTGNTPQTGDTYALANGASGFVAIKADTAAIRTSTGLIIGGRILARSPILDNGQHLTLVRGDDYNVASGQPLEWTDPAGNWPTLTSATITMTIRHKEDDGTLSAPVLTQDGSVVTATGDDKQVRVEPLTAKTSLLTPGSKNHRFDVQATLSTGERVTLMVGECTVIEDVTQA